MFDSNGNLVGFEADGDADETVTITSSAADTYTALVDAFDVPSGSTAYDYFDVFTNAAFGSVSITDAPTVHPNGDTWTRTATAQALAAPGAGRFLEGFVQVRSGSSVLGSAPVDLKNVGP